MVELIKIKTENNRQLVSARELYEFLGLSKRFSAWFDTYSKNEDYGFVEHEDFEGCTQKYIANQHGAEAERLDYMITIEMAKELSMLSKSQKGKEARKYFIQCEKKLKDVVNSNKALPSDYLSALKALVQAEEEKAIMQPKVTYYENVLCPNTYIKMITTTAIAKDLGKTAQKLNQILNDKKIIYKEKDKNWYLYKEHEDMIPQYCDYIINEHSQTLKWTEKGREFIIELLKDDNLSIAN